MRNPRVAEILSVLAHGGEQRTLPDRLCAACLSALPVSGVGVALMTVDGPSGVVLAVTDERARQLEELQFALGEGPCVEASGGGRPVLEPDLVATGTPRWPRFGAAVLDAGVHAVFAFPMRVGAIRVGVLDLYRDTPGQLSPPDLAEALAFADAATVVVLNLQDHAAEDGARSALMGPIDNRAEVHQATGMISIQLGISLADALLRLRAYAYAMEQTVSSIAADVVSRRMHFVGSESGATTQQDRRDPRE
ncbi:MAG: GAF domain-containing protein [Actinophytocola sp.]|uniref:GAF and ANTAR domain-containing protein n=1 Tax=Actinophytocola sp. TaxID=1872138 RepID=UPI001324B111|nr:GAF and ANTAR domain-containing protein [Actinophytocola sp.]MPZ82548.1 GAF domain-containing protein [Actinophytocola sp.]